MAESTKGVLEFLEQLRKERDEINTLIAGIEKRLGISPVPVTEDQTPHRATTPKVKITMGDIPLGFFHNLSQPAAAEKLLRLNPGQPLTSQEMLGVFRKTGMHLNPKNASTILYTALTRNPKFERVAGKAWGLAEWYLGGKKRNEAKRPDQKDIVETPNEADIDDDVLTIEDVVTHPSSPKGW